MKRWLIIGIPLVLILGLVGWRVSQKRAEAADQNKQREARKNAPISVEVAKATRADIVKRFEAVGSLEATLSVDVTPKVAGPIKYLQLREGDRVTQGEVIARIDPREVQATVRSREATLAGARARLAEARAAQEANNTGLTSEVARQTAALATVRAQGQQALANATTQVATARAAVADIQGRVAAAEAEIRASDAAIETAQANLANARTRQARQEALYKEGATSKELLDDARTATEVAEGALKEARERRASAVSTRDTARAQLKTSAAQLREAETYVRAGGVASRANVRQAQAALEAARANTGREQAYSSNLAALSAAVTAAQAELRAAQAQLGDTTLRAPLDGLVTRRYLDPGSLASPSAPVVALASIRRLWATVPVPEEVSRRIVVGQTASVALDAFPGKNFTGRVARIEPAADPGSRQFIVRVALDNQNGRLRPGSFARVTVVTQRENNVVTLPLEAVKKDGDTSTVTLVGPDETAQTRQVQTGLSDAKRITIEGGLQEGEAAVILSGRPLKDGQKIKVGGGERRGQGQAAQGAPGQGQATQNQENRR